MKDRVRNQLEEVHKSENLHHPIIQRETFDLVQEMKKTRTDIELDKYGNRIRESTHYSMKRSGNKAEKLIEFR